MWGVKAVTLRKPLSCPETGRDTLIVLRRVSYIYCKTFLFFLLYCVTIYMMRVMTY